MLNLKALYDTDFNLWIERQIMALREQRLEDIDLANLIEEIEDLARRDKRALRSHLKVLLLHLLKWQFQPAQCSSGWKASISNARIEIADIFSDSPSLENYLPTVVEKVYISARILAADETSLAITRFPESCPYSLTQVLDLEFLP
ncbi:MAG: DUF29 domain-containing protein [Phormidesmis sp.]